MESVEFSRGIRNKEFIQSLNQLYNTENSFWFHMVNDKTLFIAIRDEYLNVYYNGQSVCRLKYVGNSIIYGETHAKYLGINENKYIESRNGIIDEKASSIKSLYEIDKIKNNIESKYLGKEKSNSYTQILSNEILIVDVEVTLIRKKIDNPKLHSDYDRSSIDYVALEQNEKNENILVFYEAKHFTNPEIRSNTTPRVLEQISRYEDALHLHEKEVINSYKVVLQNLKELNGLSAKQQLRNNINFENLSIDFKPRLIIFDINQNDNNWINIHKNKLVDKLGSHLILK